MKLIHVTGNSASYVSIALHEDDVWAIRVLAECAQGRKDFDDLTSEQQSELVKIAQVLLYKV